MELRNAYRNDPAPTVRIVERTLGERVEAAIQSNNFKSFANEYMREDKAHGRNRLWNAVTDRVHDIEHRAISAVHAPLYGYWGMAPKGIIETESPAEFYAVSQAWRQARLSVSEELAPFKRAQDYLMV